MRDLIKKVYFPRLILPISAAASAPGGFCHCLCVLLGLMAWFGIAPTWGVLALPRLSAPGAPDGPRCVALSFSSERPLSGCAPRHSLLYPILDVCLTGSVLRQLDSRTVAVPLQLESHGRGDRGLPLGAPGKSAAGLWCHGSECHGGIGATRGWAWFTSSGWSGPLRTSCEDRG